MYIQHATQQSIWSRVLNDRYIVQIHKPILKEGLLYHVTLSMENCSCMLGLESTK